MQTQQPTASSSGVNSVAALSTPTKIGIAVGGSVGLILITSLITYYIRWLKKKQSTDGPRKISGPYVQDLEGGGKNLHGYREEELLDSGALRNQSVTYEDKALEFNPSAVELDARERSRSRSRGRGRARPERAAKPFF